MSFTDVIKKSVLEGFHTGDLSTMSMAVTLGMAVAMGLFIYAVYRLSARGSFYNRDFNKSLATLPVITAGILLAMQSNLVISLGMVGALSIVRFRTAVKEPTDTAFMFWAIATGIICGAGLYFIALPLTLILGIAILLSDEVPGVARNRILVLDGSYPYDEARTVGIVKKYAKWYNVRTESVHNDAVNLIIEVRKVKDASGLIRELRQTGAFHDVSLLVQEGTID